MGGPCCTLSSMLHDELTRELVRALRGKRSQAQLSRRLGFGTNVLYLWESGRRAPTAGHFFALARHVGVEVDSGLAAFLGGERRLKKTEQGLSDLLSRLRGDLSISELARAVGSDRTTVARWLAGKTEPPFAALLALVEVTTHRLLDFVAVFFDPAKLDTTRRAFEALLAQRALAYEDPWSHAVLRALELTPQASAPQRSTQHTSARQIEFIAERTGLDVRQVDAALTRLSRAGQVRKRRGRYSLATVLPVDTRNDPNANLRLKQHWLEVAGQRLAQSRAQGVGLYSYNLFAVSDDGFEKIRRLHLDYFERLRTIVSEENGGQRVALVNLQLVPLDE